jgi:hypothetical protein
LQRQIGLHDLGESLLESHRTSPLRPSPIAGVRPK